MKLSLIFVTLIASAGALDIKEKLQQFRDPSGVKEENVIKFVNNRHESRMNKLAELLEDRKMQLSDHEAGHRKLSADDHAHVSRQAKNFERKLTQLKNIDPSEHADMYQHDAESLYRMNSVDYLDFELKK